MFRSRVDQQPDRTSATRTMIELFKLEEGRAFRVRGHHGRKLSTLEPGQPDPRGSKLRLLDNSDSNFPVCVFLGGPHVGTKIAIYGGEMVNPLPQL